MQNIMVLVGDGCWDEVMKWVEGKKTRNKMLKKNPKRMNYSRRKITTPESGSVTHEFRSTYCVVDPLEKRVAVLSRGPQGFLHFNSWIQVRFQDLVNRLNCELLIEQVEELTG